MFNVCGWGLAVGFGGLGGGGDGGLCIDLPTEDLV